MVSQKKKKLTHLTDAISIVILGIGPTCSFPIKLRTTANAADVRFCSLQFCFGLVWFGLFFSV